MDLEWRCTRCQRLLGHVRGRRLHLTFARGLDYLVGFPATHACRRCRVLNELTNPRSLAEPEALR